MSRIARSRLFAGASLGAAIALAVADLLVGFHHGPAWALIGFTSVQALSWASASRLQPNDSQAVFQVDEALFVAGALLLPPAGLVLALGLGTAIGAFVDRMPPRMVAFNSAILVLASSASLAGAGLVLHESILSTEVGQAAGAAALACVAMALLSDVLLASYFRFSLRKSFAPELVVLVKERFPRIVFLIAIGALSGVAGRLEPALTALGLPLIVGLVLVLGEHSRATRDRQRTQGLFEASVDVHSSVDSDAVRTALISAATRLLRCNQARLATTPPGEEEWGAQIQSIDDLWLVVSEPMTLEPLDREALNLLDALAAVGAAALENARLVETIQHQAVTDPVTGLANQVLFEDRVSQAIANARRSRERFVVMVLDLDAFKKVNDSLGHSHGNAMLRLMGDRLAGSVRDIDTVAHLGSDHFTILLPGVGDADEAAVVSEKLLSVIRRPVSLGGHELFMTASAGLAFFPEDGTRAEHLIRNADGAMHRAKDMGRDTFQVYASGMNEAAHMRLVRESELHVALQRDELRLRYQPQIDLRTGKIVGVEALVRWEHPVLGLIGPQEFVPLAEESGLIVAVDTWVMKRACEQARAWLDAGLPPLTMAVNLSGRHFQTNDRLLETVKLALLESGLDASALELEVTEGIAVGEEHGTGKLLQQVRELGVRIAIDDFGTGYSMLGRLQKFPIDKLKIDRSFVMEIETAHGEAPIVAAMIAMARSLKIEVCAEGVETLEQQTFLRFHGCDQAQGYLFSQPVEVDDIEHLLLTPSLGINVTAAS
jgi:diguanylate cyclase (GGDEF)-like protein